MKTARAYNLLHELTKPMRKGFAKHYTSVSIAWLDCAAGDEHQRLALIQRAARKDSQALAALDAITAQWEAKHGKRARYGSIPLAALDAVGNGAHEVFGNRRSSWQRFATYVALRAVTSHRKYQVMRASYAQIGALSLGFPTIAAAVAAGVDMSAQHSIYRKVQRSIRAFARAGMVLQWQQQGYRTCFYSYRISDATAMQGISAELASNKRNIRMVRELIADVSNQPNAVIAADDAATVYSQVKALGWHDTALLDIPQSAVAGLVTATERIAGRKYVRLSRCSATELQHSRNQLHSIVGRYVLSRSGT
jgi:hypothetical protein